MVFDKWYLINGIWEIVFDKVYLIKSISAVTNYNSSSCLEETDCFGGLCCPDSSDYIGCFKYHSIFFQEKIIDYKGTEMTPCYCIGHCILKNYSLAVLDSGRHDFL